MIQLQQAKAKRQTREDDMESLVRFGLCVYIDACGLDAESAWCDDPRLNEEADAAWRRYEGVRWLLSQVFGITEGQVAEDFEQLLLDHTFYGVAA